MKPIKIMQKLISDRASAAVEFAVSLPVLVLIIAGVVDYAQAVNISTKLSSAARAGAQYAIKYPNDLAGITAATTGATSDSSMSAPTVSRFCTCGDSSASQTAWSTCIGGTFTCSTTGTITARFYVAVSTTQAYTPLISITSLPLFGSINIGEAMTGGTKSTLATGCAVTQRQMNGCAVVQVQ